MKTHTYCNTSQYKYSGKEPTDIVISKIISILEGKGNFVAFLEDIFHL